MIRRGVVTLGLGLLALAAACNGTRKGEYADSTNPAMVNDTSTVQGRPDSTTGINERTGRPGVAGDSSRNRTQGNVPEKKP